MLLFTVFPDGNGGGGTVVGGCVTLSLFIADKRVAPLGGGGGGGRDTFLSKLGGSGAALFLFSPAGHDADWLGL